MTSPSFRRGRAYTRTSARSIHCASSFNLILCGSICRMNTLDETMRKTLWDMFHEDGNWFVILGRRLKEFQREKWPRSFVDCVFQYDWHHTVDIFDLHFLQVATALTNSKHATVAVFQIPVGCTPYPDEDVHANNEALAALPSPFAGRFWGGTQGEDGIITWSRPIHVSVQRHGQPGWSLVEPGSVQLEVGYNSSGKFHRALHTSNGIARWPYGQNCITVFLNAALRLVTPGQEKFAELQHNSSETILECMAQGRSPWERWSDETDAQRRSIIRRRRQARRVETKQRNT